MKREPKMRKQGGVYVCAVCEKRLGEIAVRNSDPFCTTDCCRSFYGCPVPKPRRGELVASSL